MSDVHEKLMELRSSLAGRRISCPDCQILRADLIKLIDLAVDTESDPMQLPPKEGDPVAPVPSVVQHSHSEVRMEGEQQTQPPVAMAGAGYSPAPGVVITPGPSHEG